MSATELARKHSDNSGPCPPPPSSGTAALEKMRKPLSDCLASVRRLFDLSAETLLVLVDGEF